MDVKTGDILTFDNDQDLKDAQKIRDMVELKGQPKKNCKKCYGVGHLGRDVNTHKFILCPCVKKPHAEAEKEG